MLVESSPEAIKKVQEVAKINIMILHMLICCFLTPCVRFCFSYLNLLLLLLLPGSSPRTRLRARSLGNLAL